MNVAPETEQGKWKRFANEKEADEYKPGTSDSKDSAKESTRIEKGSGSE
jgi:hypothetical protein